MDDVYGKGFIDTIREERQKTAVRKRELADVNRELKEAEAELAAQQEAEGDVRAEPKRGKVTDDDYREAKTWDGLEAIGYKGDWREIPVRAQDDYTP